MKLTIRGPLGTPERLSIYRRHAAATHQRAPLCAGLSVADQHGGRDKTKQHVTIRHRASSAAAHCGGVMPSCCVCTGAQCQPSYDANVLHAGMYGADPK